MTGKKVCTGFSTDPTTVALVTWHTSVKTFFFFKYFRSWTRNPRSREQTSLVCGSLPAAAGHVAGGGFLPVTSVLLLGPGNVLGV